MILITRKFYFTFSIRVSNSEIFIVFIFWSQLLRNFILIYYLDLVTRKF